MLEQAAPKHEAWTVACCIGDYVRHNAVPVSDVKLLDTLRATVKMLSTRNLNYDWAEAWVAQMTRVQHLAPSTIRHRLCALYECTGLSDGLIAKITGHRNPRTLKRYASLR